MSNVSVTKPYQQHRRFSREFKAEIVAQCLALGASDLRISLDNGLNANMVRRWISEARQMPEVSSMSTPGLLPVNLPAAPSAPGNTSAPDQRSAIRIEVPRTGGRLWWSGLATGPTSVPRYCGSCWDDPHRPDLAGH